MRNKLIAIVFLLMTECSFGQVDFTGGLVFGGATSQISGDALAGWNKFGMAGGAWIHMDFNGVIGTYMGMQFTNKGSKKPADVANGDNNVFSFQLNYIDVPLLMTYSKTNWRFGLGPTVGVLVGQKQIYNGIELDITPPFETLDLAGTLSVTRIVGDHLMLEWRGGTSIIPIRPAPQVVNKGSFYEKGMYNQVMMLMLNWRF
jgi:Outer membrane protein beta-barrel domain